MNLKYLPSKLAFTIGLFICVTDSYSQTVVQEINNLNTTAVALAPLRFLASDELMGRGTSRPEIHIAARYISEAFRSYSLKEVTGTSDYFQTFTIDMFTSSDAGLLTINDKHYNIGEALIQISGTDISLDAPIIFAGYGTDAELDKLAVKGKIIVVKWGSKDADSPEEGFDLLESKQRSAAEKGAAALIQIAPSSVPWKYLRQYFAREQAITSGTGNMSTFLINDSAASLTKLEASQVATLSATGSRLRNIPAKNVMGWVEGTDPKLRNQFIVLSAHYDHLGVAKKSQLEEGKQDSIYNGARDNAIGTTAVIDAAGYFSLHPPKRSVLFIAFTAEEMGLIGSKYFATHPAMPLKQLVYDLNIDNASYNDTNAISLVGLERTSADEDIKKACDAYGLSILPDPTPGKELFNGSDNLPLAEKGIPAPTFSLGMKSFDESILNRYHQLSDEVENFNSSYAVKFIKAFILAAKYIADDEKQPTWTKGDKYEPAWKALYH